MTALDRTIMDRMAVGNPRIDDCRPMIVVVDDDGNRRALLHTELSGRYGGAYRVLVSPTPMAARSALEEVRADGSRVALVLASQWMAEMDGSAFLAWVRSRHPRSKRALLVAADDWGRENTAAAIRTAIASGCVDDMPWVVLCFCGTAIRGKDEDELVVNAQDHAKTKHALTVTREQVLAMAESEG
jgi:predicted small metal-binding protein